MNILLPDPDWRNPVEDLENYGDPDPPSQTVPCPPARQAVEAWRIARLGRRPQDHIARDLLLNSPLPTLLVWGSETIVVFNEAYAQLAGRAMAACRAARCLRCCRPRWRRRARPPARRRSARRADAADRISFCCGLIRINARDPHRA